MFKAKAWFKRYLLLCSHSLIVENKNYSSWSRWFELVSVAKFDVLFLFYYVNLSAWRSQNGEHAPYIVLEYTHLDKTFVADLRLNQNLFPEHHFLRSQNSDGTKYVQTFNRSSLDLCHYQVSMRVFLRWFNLKEKFLLILNSLFCLGSTTKQPKLKSSTVDMRWH